MKNVLALECKSTSSSAASGNSLVSIWLIIINKTRHNFVYAIFIYLLKENATTCVLFQNRKMNRLRYIGQREKISKEFETARRRRSLKTKTTTTTSRIGWTKRRQSHDKFSAMEIIDKPNNNLYSFVSVLWPSTDGLANQPIAFPFTIHPPIREWHEMTELNLSAWMTHRLWIESWVTDWIWTNSVCVSSSMEMIGKSSDCVTMATVLLPIRPFNDDVEEDDDEKTISKYHKIMNKINSRIEMIK